MRSVDRLPKFYNQLAEFHAKVPDLRFGQLMFSFSRWHEWEYGSDIFYLEEDEFLEHFKIYLKDIQAKYVGIEGKFEK